MTNHSDDPEDWPVEPVDEPPLPDEPRFPPEVLAEIAELNRLRPIGRPEGDGTRERPVWREIDHTDLVRPSGR